MPKRSPATYQCAPCVKKRIRAALNRDDGYSSVHWLNCLRRDRGEESIAARSRSPVRKNTLSDDRQQHADQAGPPCSIESTLYRNCDKRKRTARTITRMNPAFSGLNRYSSRISCLQESLPTFEHKLRALCLRSPKRPGPARSSSRYSHNYLIFSFICIILRLIFE
jgi:hypothetical protein